MKSGLGIMSALALSVMATVAHAQGTGDVIRIGILNDQSGPYADVSGKGTVIAAKLAVEEFGGKLLGNRIEVIPANHQNKPDIASAIARQWIDNRERRCHRRLRRLFGRPRHSAGHPRLGPDLHHQRSGLVGLHRQGLLAHRVPLHLRHLCSGQRNRQGSGQAGR